MSDSLLGIGAAVIIWLLTVAWMIIVTLRMVGLERRFNDLVKNQTHNSEDSANATKIE